jgi:malate permease and related proteins
MLIGYIASRTLHLDKRSISALVIYFITPAIVFYGTASIPFSSQTIALPLIAFAFFTLSGIAARYICRVFGLQKHENMIAFMGGNGNTGYYGIPLVIAVLWEQFFPYAVLVGLGALLHENSIGMYYLARATFTPQQAIRKVLTMPTLYGFLLGCLAALIGVKFGPFIQDFFVMYKHVYIVVWMMIIGIGLDRQGLAGTINWKFLCYNLFHKFVIMPVIFIGGSIVMCSLFPALLEFQQVFFLISIVPIAAGTISLAIEFKQDVYQAALCVVVSTILALPLVPILIFYI